MLKNFVKALRSRTPEEKTLSELDKDFSDFAKYFTEKIEVMIGSNAMVTDVSAGFQTIFSKRDWAALVGWEFQKLKDKDFDKFKSVMESEFNMVSELRQGEPVEIDLDLSEDDPHPIDYFTGFIGLRGYESLREKCAAYGMDVQLFFDPQDEDTARIGFVLYSVDRRPLKMCLRDPVPSEQIYIYD